jgi:predicted transcriptional regulator
MNNKKLIVLLFVEEFPMKIISTNCQVATAQLQSVAEELENEGFLTHNVRAGGIPLYELTKKGDTCLLTLQSFHALNF